MCSIQLYFWLGIVLWKIKRLLHCLLYGWKLRLFVLDLNNKRQWSKCDKKSLLWGIRKFLFCIDTARRFNFSTQFCHFHPSMQTTMFTKLSTWGVNMRKHECGLNVYAHLAKTVIFCNCLASFIPVQTNKGIIWSGSCLTCRRRQIKVFKCLICFPKLV